MRGKGNLKNNGEWENGITPAYAGKSLVQLFLICRSQDHPRLCGEKLKGSILMNTKVGSPPPMRGKVDKGSIFAKSLRITPAYAGKSRHTTGFYCLRRDHPRLCGEKQLSPTGSIAHFGITPAYAGKRCMAAAPCFSRMDHPRLCGEKWAEDGATRQAAGSPPPMRGKVIACYLAGAVYGITPAYAGKSGVHDAYTPDRVGSPPPMRGKASGDAVSDSVSGITPAYAGKSIYHVRQRLSAKDHPRLCGEKSRHRHSHFDV